MALVACSLLLAAILFWGSIFLFLHVVIMEDPPLTARALWSLDSGKDKLKINHFLYEKNWERILSRDIALNHDAMHQSMLSIIKLSIM